MFRDHYVDFKREEVVHAQAQRLRELVGAIDEPLIDVIGVLQWLQKHGLEGKGKLTLKVLTEMPEGVRAFVTFSPLILNVDRKVIEYARWKNDPYSRYIIAHEIGHIAMHDHNAKPFSEGDIKYSKYGFEEVSAERQADWFADYFLLPDNVLSRYESIDEIMKQCCVTRILAESRFPKRRSQKAFENIYLGDACAECFNFMLYRKEGLIMCNNCGHSKSGIQL